LSGGNLTVAREYLIKHLFEVDTLTMGRDELRANDRR